MALKVRKTELTQIDEGEYPAVVTSIQEKDGKWGKYYIWGFLIKGATRDDEPLKGLIKVTGITSEHFSEGSKLFKWAKAAGLDTSSEEIDLDDAVKEIVRVYVEDDESDDGRAFSKVAKVKKAKPKDKKKLKAAEEEEERKGKGKKKKSKKPKKEVEEDDEDEEEEEEEKPKKKKKATKAPAKKAKKKKKQEEEEDDDDEDEDLDEDEDDDDDVFELDDDEDDDD